MVSSGSVHDDSELVLSMDEVHFSLLARDHTRLRTKDDSDLTYERLANSLSKSHGGLSLLLCSSNMSAQTDMLVLSKGSGLAYINV